MFCEVVIPHAPLDELTFSFESIQFPALAPGDFVLVPLRKKPVVGVVLKITDAPSYLNKDVQPVLKILGKEVVAKQLLSLAHWVADYYLCHLGEVLGLIVPKQVGVKDFNSQPVPVVSSSSFSVALATEETGFKARAQNFIAQALGLGSVVFLMPEPYFAAWIPFLKRSFDNAVVEYHHRLPKRELRANWVSLLAPDNKVVVGVRSAVWAPVKNLAGVVIVSEHSPAFKEERQPKYNARDVAIARAKIAGCPVLILDPTPAVETCDNVKRRRFTLLNRLRLPRFQEGVFVVDMRLHRNELISPRLLRELNLARDKKGSALLYINRLGLSRFVVCEECGQVLKCPNCLVPVLVTGAAEGSCAERRTGRIVCRLCGYMAVAPDFCSQCHGAQFLFRAPGVEMVVRSLKKLGVEAQIFSADENQAQVLVGTKRMLSCEVERDLGLIALVNFDTELALPDFRSRERAFALLIELLQRARRAQARVVIQTYRPDDPVLNLALAGDVTGFINEELKMRQEAGFPPYKRLIAITLNGRDEKKIRCEAEALVRDLERISGVEVFTPMPLMHKEVKIILKLPRDVLPGRMIDRKILKRSGVKIKVDVDPLKVI